MVYKSRQLRRLWRCVVFTGEVAEGAPTREDTVIAFNAVEAIRAAGNCALQPEPICYVTWDEEPRRIETTAGPTEEVVQPTISAHRGD